MNTLIPSHKAVIDQDDLILFVCPDCGFSKNISAEEFRHRERVLDVKCKCGHSFKVELELRLRIRKATNIEGH